MAVGAVLVLVRGGDEVTIGRLRGDACDLAIIDALARLQLAARRMGCSLRLRDAADDLRGLLEFSGLGSLFGEAGRKPEGRKEVGVQEVVDLDDPVA